MRIRILLAGKVRGRHFAAGMAEYRKRLGPYARVEVLKLGDEAVSERASAAEAAAAWEREGERILKAAGEGPYLVELDIPGQAMSSEGFAAFLQERALRGDSDLAFAIGGSTGLAPAVLARARLRLSFGPMTLPHQMVPMLLLEQVYRAFKIQAGEPYHKHRASACSDCTGSIKQSVQP